MRIDLVEIGNFRKLQAVRIGLAKDKTVFVGANNSGKTSAMVALRQFLVGRERERFSFNDFTVSYWPDIDKMGEGWEAAQESGQPLSDPSWSKYLPFLDVWLFADTNEAHYVQKLIPTLDWDGGRLGVRLRFEPRDQEALRKEYLFERGKVTRLSEIAENSGSGAETDAIGELRLWPKNLTEFLRRRLTKLFSVNAYILDPTKLIDPQFGTALPQAIDPEALPIEGDPFEGLIRIDEIGAQRGFGYPDGSKDQSDEEKEFGNGANRRMSEQLRRYWNKHLNPSNDPDVSDLAALKAINDAQDQFDRRLGEGFGPALKEIEGLGYPGVTDPRLKISTSLKPVDGLKHGSAVQYVVETIFGQERIKLNLPEDSNGLGYQNLISMVFRLMSFRDAWMRVGKAALQEGEQVTGVIPPLHLVLIEEPEAHLHTQVQQVFIRQAYGVLRKHAELGCNTRLTTQMIVSTHSSHVAHECPFSALRYFRRMSSNGSGVPTSCVVDLSLVFGSDKETERFVTRYLNVTHSDLLFADAAVLVEGPAERILIPFFVQHDPALERLSECYVTWLEIGGSHAHRLRPLIEHLGLITLIITDLDAMDDDGAASAPARKQALKSRNATLNTWCPAKVTLDDLWAVPNADKVRAYQNERFSVRVAYQAPIQVTFKGSDVEACSNTLEDALVMQNLGYFSNAEGGGLQGRIRKSIERSATIGDLQNALFDDLKKGGKAELALDLLTVNPPSKLEAPGYIKDGLVWLADQLQKQQEELGIVPVAMVEGAKVLPT